MSMPPILPTLSSVDLRNKRVLIRQDLNVPLNADQVITDHTRIMKALPTINYAVEQGARVIIASHLGRPVPGSVNSEYSLKPVAEALSERLKQQVCLIEAWDDGVKVAPGQVVLLENVRFLAGEQANDPQLAKQLASLCEVFVMDAFATAHRAHASTSGICQWVGTVCAGPLLAAELGALNKALAQPQPPLTAIVGGSKVSTKIAVLENLLDRVNVLLVGGGIANTLLAASGVDVGASLYEADWLQRGRALLAKAESKGVLLPLPQDVVTAEQFACDAPATIKTVDQLQATDQILDVGPQTQAHYAALLHKAGTIVWNGPLGVFEWPAFAAGTRALAQAVAASSAYSIAGGGDTLAALAKFAVSDKIDYISTGGGAFLTLLEGKPLPAVEALLAHTQQPVAS